MASARHPHSLAAGWHKGSSGTQRGLTWMLSGDKPEASCEVGGSFSRAASLCFKRHLFPVLPKSIKLRGQGRGSSCLCSAGTAGHPSPSHDSTNPAGQHVRPAEPRGSISDGWPHGKRHPAALARLLARFLALGLQPLHLLLVLLHGIRHTGVDHGLGEDAVRGRIGGSLPRHS